MEQHSQQTREQEPVGIIISRGGERGETAPRFSAYMWSDAPEVPAEPATRRAA
ncbi:MAG TPA: hypothetical protein VGE02_11195 [Gemmatimonadales bacterium]